MQQFEDIQSIWDSHTVDVKISAEEMLTQAKKEVGNMKNKSALNIWGMISMLLAIAVLWFFMDISYWMTHLALMIMITTIGIYTFILYRDYRLISKTDFTVHPSQFLEKLKLYQVNRFQLYNRLYWFYVLALTLSIVLYFFEITANFEVWAQVLICLFSIAWMIFCSTIFRKAVLQREKEKISTLIEKFTRISHQFQEKV